MTRFLIAAATGLALAGLATGCGHENDADEHDPELATASVPCLDDATATEAPYPGELPADWAFPPQTTVISVEDRGTLGTVATAVTGAPFQAVLDFFNDDVASLGYRVTEGESEEHDAEANWTGNGHHGRWAIRESAACPGETVIQVLAASTAADGTPLPEETL